MAAGHAQAQRRHLLVTQPDLGVGPAAGVGAQRTRLPIGLSRQAVGADRGPVRRSIPHRQRPGIVGADDQQTLGRQLRHKLPERGGEGARGRVAVDVIPLNVGDDGDFQPQAEEHAVVLVRLDDERPLPGTRRERHAGHPLGRPHLDPAANDQAGIHPGAQQDRRDHAGGRGLAVRAGDADAVLSFHQGSQEVAAFDHRDARRVGRD